MTYMDSSVLPILSRIAQQDYSCPNNLVISIVLFNS